jgi:hypothetical protein
VTSEKPRQFQIVLRAPTGTPDAERRLAMVLKYALRRFGFVCLLAAPEPAGPSPDSDPARQPAHGNLPPRRR